MSARQRPTSSKTHSANDNEAAGEVSEKKAAKDKKGCFLF